MLSIPKDDPKDNLKNDTNQMLEALNLENGKLKMQCEELQAKVKELEEGKKCWLRDSHETGLQKPIHQSVV